MQRKDEILAKKAKLAELRRQREEREQRQKLIQRESLGAATSTPDASTRLSSVHTSSSRLSADRNELDNFIETLVGDRSRPGEASSSARSSRLSSAGRGVTVGAESYEERDARVNYSNAETQTTTDVDQETTHLVSTPSEPVKRYVDTYSKGVQTESFEELDREGDGDITEAGDEGSQKGQEKEEQLRQNLRKEIEQELQAAKDLSLTGRVSTQKSGFPVRELTLEELNAVTSSDDFFTFVDRSSKVIEKALEQDYDVLADYALDGRDEDAEEDSDDDDEDHGAGRRSRTGKNRRLKQVAQFWDAEWTKKRMISDVNFSPKFPELVLASYTKNPSISQDPAGLVHIWNLHLHSRPEYTFQNTSDILTARFSPYHPSLVIGGSYSGQVLLWDTRSRGSMPSAKTPLTGTSAGGHTHPIYSVSIVGTQNANNIISCSTDGTVCAWTTEMLTVPQERLQLVTPPPARTEDLSPMCMGFASADPTSFLVGTEEGTIYSCHRYDRASAKAGVDAKLRYKSHRAPVTSLDFHPNSGPADFGNLFLSTGLDWSVKLWRTTPSASSVPATTTATKPPSTTANTKPPITNYGATPPLSNQETTIEPILDLIRDDAAYDARWSPSRPGVFATVNGTGNVEVWNLVLDREVPIAKATPQMEAEHHGAFVPRSLNKVAWDHKDGKRLGVGGAAGVLTVFEAGRDLSGEGAREEEWTRMKRVVTRR